MTAFKFEYIWLDGYNPEPNLRSKTKVLHFDEYNGEIEKLPDWSFDGSSTQQAEGHSSDCVLKPVRVYPDPTRINAYLVMTEVMNIDGTPHPSNTRALIKNDSDEFWFGFEQEYTMMDGTRPMGFPKQGFPAPQGMYYCSVGNKNVAGRVIVEEHLDICLEAGLSLTGINAEVLLGQWEYQCFGKGAKKSADDLWISRYLLYRLTEEYGLGVELHPKPVEGDWNGSGMHVNFSTKHMREIGGEDLFKNICEAFAKHHKEHIDVYGSNNDMRLTGLHETQNIDTFSYGYSDRGASIRIPVCVHKTGKGYLEDRRPASNADPYKVVGRMLETLSTVSSNITSV